MCHNLPNRNIFVQCIIQLMNKYTDPDSTIIEEVGVAKSSQVLFTWSG